MNKTINLNQEPKIIADEALEIIKPYFPPGNYKYCKGNIELAINLIENKLAMVATKINGEWFSQFNITGSKFVALSSALEILKQEIK